MVWNAAFRHRRLDAQRRHALGRHQHRQGLGGKNPKVEAEFEANKAAFLGSGADSLQTLIDIIHREKIDCGCDHQRPFHRRLDAEAL